VGVSWIETKTPL